MNFKLPQSSIGNNRFFHPIVSNAKYRELLNLKTLPILANAKEAKVGKFAVGQKGKKRSQYIQEINKYKNKLKINECEIRKYSECLAKLNKASPAHQFMNTAVETQEEINFHEKNGESKWKIVIEVIKGWTSDYARLAKKTLPVIEIQKACEYDSSRSTPFVTDNEKWEIKSSNVIWSQVYEMVFNENISNVHKKFKISWFEKDKNKRNVQIGGSFTISVITNLESQEVIFKTFDFNSGFNEPGWSVLTRIQFVYDKPNLYRKIIQKLEERKELFEHLIEKIKGQRIEKIRKMTQGQLTETGGNEEPSAGDSWLIPNKMCRHSSSQYAGYYSESWKSAMRSYRHEQELEEEEGEESELKSVNSGKSWSEKSEGLSDGLNSA
jgi:hypothetical protein